MTDNAAYNISLLIMVVNIWALCACTILGMIHSQLKKLNTREDEKRGEVKE